MKPEYISTTTFSGDMKKVAMVLVNLLFGQIIFADRRFVRYNCTCKK